MAKREAAAAPPVEAAADEVAYDQLTIFERMKIWAQERGPGGCAASSSTWCLVCSLALVGGKVVEKIVDEAPSFEEAKVDQARRRAEGDRAVRGRRDAGRPHRIEHRHADAGKAGPDGPRGRSTTTTAPSSSTRAAASRRDTQAAEPRRPRRVRHQGHRRRPGRQGQGRRRRRRGHRHASRQRRRRLGIRRTRQRQPQGHARQRRRHPAVGTGRGRRARTGSPGTSRPTAVGASTATRPAARTPLAPARAAPATTGRGHRPGAAAVPRRRTDARVERPLPAEHPRRHLLPHQQSEAERRPAHGRDDVRPRPGLHRAVRVLRHERRQDRWAGPPRRR